MSDFTGIADTACADAGANATHDPRILSLSGRLGRLRYWIYGAAQSLAMIPLFAIAFGASLLTHEPPGLLQMFVIFLGYGAVVFGGVVLIRRRLNDLDKSGWLALLMLVPLLNALFGLWILFCPGTQGPNRFGPEPSPNSGAIIGAAWMLGAFTLAAVFAAFAIVPAMLAGLAAGGGAGGF